MLFKAKIGIQWKFSFDLPMKMNNYYQDSELKKISLAKTAKTALLWFENLAEDPSVPLSVAELRQVWTG